MGVHLRIYHDERTLLHDGGPGHPERADRVASIMARAAAGEFGEHSIVQPDPAERAAIERVHDPAYVDRVEATRSSERTVFDADTSANEHSWLAASLAAGGAIAATREALADGSTRGFVVMRPPGHHAEADHAMGFCLFNNAAVAAAEALANGVTRVAVVDWDVHHGNGTEHIFYDRADVLYVSLHQAPHYPGTGRSREIGRDAGAGHNVNVPLPSGSGADEYLAVFDSLVVPVLDQYRPELVLVSAGFDAHERDPLAGMLLDGEAYAALTGRLVDVADAHAGGRIVHLLEGGYDLTGLADGFAAVTRVLAGGHANANVPGSEPSHANDRAARMAALAIDETRAALAGYWRLGPVR